MAVHAEAAVAGATTGTRPGGLTLAPPRPQDESSRAGSPVGEYLDRLHRAFAPVRDGVVASYIPQLALADPDSFGICLATVDGAIYETGDSRQPFTLQSISKPLAYGIALEQHGEDGVRRRIGVEPSGEAFNAISLDPATGTPRNAMINAGAITASWLAVQGADHPLDRLLDVFSRFTGRRLRMDEAVCQSERETGFRNRAIAHLLRNAGVIDGDPDAAADLYFQQCAIEVDCRDLGVIAATLANGGLNPITGERAVRADAVRDVLSVMSSCGMYDAAGAWLVEIGLPAKSGVSGGLLAVLPGRLGIGVYSPPLDERGNSVRGLAVCRAISRDHALHLVRPGEIAPSPIRTAATVAESGSKRVRPARDQAELRRVGREALAIELQGELDFRAVELVARRVGDLPDTPRFVVLDLTRVTRVHLAVAQLLADFAAGLSADGGRLVLSGGGTRAELVREVTHELAGRAEPAASFEDLDHALEWCEMSLLHDAGLETSVPTVDLSDHELLEGLDEEELARVLPALRACAYPPGAVLFEEGDPADAMYLVTEGDLSVSVRGGDGRDRRVATLSAGMLFGELALVDRGPRTASVSADTDVVCHALSFTDLDEVGAAHPALKATLLAGVLRVSGRTARRLSAEVSAIAE